MLPETKSKWSKWLTISPSFSQNYNENELIKVNEKCATKISIHSTMFSPHYVPVIPIYTESMETGRDL